MPKMRYKQFYLCDYNINKIIKDINILFKYKLSLSLSLNFYHENKYKMH